MRAPHAGLPAAAAETSASCGLPAAATACWADLYVAGDSRFCEACLLTGDWESHFSRESQYSVGAGHRRLHRNMQCYFSIVPGCATLPTFLCYAMLCHSISTALKLSSSSDCALSVSLLLYCIKQWDQSTGLLAFIVNIGPTIHICLIQMALRSAHGVGISFWWMVAQLRAPNTGGVSINVSSESYNSISCVARDACRIFVCFLWLCKSIQSFT